MSQPDIEASESAYRIICFVGQLACIEAGRGNRGAIKVACSCYADLRRNKFEVPTMLEDFILARLDMVASGKSKDAFPGARAANRPKKFDDFGFAVAFLEELKNQKTPVEDFEKFYSESLHGKGGLGDQWGCDFDVRTLQRALEGNLRRAAELLSLEPQN